MGKGKYIMEIIYRKELSLSFLYPAELGKALALGTVPVATGVVSRMLITAMAACLHMPTQVRCPAHFNCMHDLMVGKGHPVVPAVLVSKLPEDIGQFPL